MKTSKKANTNRLEILDRISQQVECIRDQQHIKSIQKQNDYEYIIEYFPHTIKSPYNQKRYNLRLQIPNSYPEGAPSLYFISRIYHLNIDSDTGEVRMPVVQDDWSPFLTLGSLFESLDTILVEPEENYAVNHEILQLYCNKRDLYMKKVGQSTKLEQIVYCQTPEERGNQSPIYSYQQEEETNLKEKEKRKSNKLVMDFRQSMQLIEKRNKLDDQIEKMEYENLGYDKIVRTQSKEQLLEKKNKNLGEKQGSRMSYQKQIDRTESALIIQEGEEKKISRHEVTFSKDVQKGKGQPIREPANELLGRINQTISIFLEELNQIELQLQQTKNRQIKELLKQKHEKQLKMIKQLMQVCEEVKRRIVRSWKQEVKKLDTILK